jgi:CRP-like cAMP-binding protein
LLVLDRRAFAELLDREIPSVYRRMMTELSDRLRATDALYADTVDRLGGC